MRLIIYDGDSFYELDEDCLKKREEEERQKEISWQAKRQSPAGKQQRQRRIRRP
ncbi:MAG: hypothetical protein LUC83_04785 [Clostridiales bacterium]|nr:hypothetical protein [Clostridiales bacterium]